MVKLKFNSVADTEDEQGEYLSSSNMVRVQFAVSPGTPVFIPLQIKMVY